MDGLIVYYFGSNFTCTPKKLTMSELIIFRINWHNCQVTIFYLFLRSCLSSCNNTNKLFIGKKLKSIAKLRRNTYQVWRDEPMTSSVLDVISFLLSSILFLISARYLGWHYCIWSVRIFQLYAMECFPCKLKLIYLVSDRYDGQADSLESTFIQQSFIFGFVEI